MKTFALSIKNMRELDIYIYFKVNNDLEKKG